MRKIPLKESFYLFHIYPQANREMSEFKVEFSDANNAAQYDTSAADVSSLYRGEDGARLYIGDRDSLSMVQIRHRQLSRVLNCHGLCLRTFPSVVAVSYKKVPWIHLNTPSRHHYHHPLSLSDLSFQFCPSSSALPCTFASPPAPPSLLVPSC